MPSPARFPGVPLRAGHYESFYVKACHPDGGLGVWIRYTVHKRPSRPAKGYLWFTLFDAHSGVVASKQEVDHPAADEGACIRLGGAVFAPGRLVGRADSALLQVEWDLRFECSEPPLRHLPYGWMYTAPFPRTKVLTPCPRAVFHGRIEAGGRRMEIEGWPGTVGHNWGTEHARTAIWLHGASFAGHPEAWLDVAIGKVGLGPVTTPWLANGAVSLGGVRYRLGGLRHVRATRIEERVESCRFRLTGEGITIDGEASAPRPRFVGWIYTQPAGGERQTINSSIADLRIEVSRPRVAPVVLEVRGGAAYELQMEDRYPAIPVQPFPDG
jgi:hypothetical protein